jgi:hypothetical protein
MRKMKNAYTNFPSEKLKIKRPLGRPSHRWEDNMKVYLKEMGCDCVDSIHVTHDKVQ